MSHAYRGPNANARDALAGILDKAHGLPVRGQHVGANAHLGPPIAETHDGTGPVPFGWSSFYAFRNDPDEVIWLPEPETGSKLARLNPAEQAQLAAARAQAEPHDPEPEALRTEAKRK